MSDTQFINQVEQHMLQLGQAQGALAGPAAYHLGRLGRHNRARLVALVAGDGAMRRQLVSAVAACELVHEASLVHDDLQDLDDERRGQVPVWQKFGEDAALLLGDHLIASGFAALTTPAWQNSPVQGQLIALLAASIRQAAEGQYLQLSASARHTADRETFETIARCKTGALMALPLQFGGVLRGLKPAEVAALGRCGGHLGVAYQILNDTQALKAGPDNRDLKQALLTAPYVEARLMAPELEPVQILSGGGPAVDMVSERLRFWLARATGAALQELDRLPEEIKRAITAFIEAKLQAPAQAVSPQVAEPAEPASPMYASA